MVTRTRVSPQLADEPQEEEAAADEDAPKTVAGPTPKLSELQRLAYVVQTIDNATCVVPKGAFLLTPSGVIERNLAFGGEGCALSTAGPIDHR